MYAGSGMFWLCVHTCDLCVGLLLSKRAGTSLALRAPGVARGCSPPQLRHCFGEAGQGLGRKWVAATERAATAATAATVAGAAGSASWDGQLNCKHELPSIVG